jgi:ABC-2 type transport system permease protein
MIMEKTTRTATTEETVLKGSAQESAEPSVREEQSFRAAPNMDKSPLHGLWALTNRDLKKWYKNPILLIMSLIQPIIWLGLFGKALNFVAFITGSGATKAQINQIMLSTFGTTSYFSYLSCGMLAFIILFTAAFGGMSVVFDKRFGFMDKVLTTPVGRGSIVLGKVFQCAIRALILASIVLVVAIVLGMDTSHLTVSGILGAYSILFLFAFGLSSIFVMLALGSSDWQTQMAIVNLLNLPLLMASNALFPVSIMPTWLQDVVKVNPVSYAVDAIRQLLIGATGMTSIATDFAVMVGFAVILSALGIVLSWKLLTK